MFFDTAKFQINFLSSNYFSFNKIKQFSFFISFTSETEIILKDLKYNVCLSFFFIFYFFNSN